jgi:hypothetical protein
MDDPQVFQRHPHRPIATAVLEPCDTTNKHPAGPRFGIACAKESANEFTLAPKSNVKRPAATRPSTQAKQGAGNQQLEPGQPGAGRCQMVIPWGSHCMVA